MSDTQPFEVVSATLEEAAQGWEDTARLYAQNVNYWRTRADAAEARAARLAAALEKHAEERHNALKSEGLHTGRFIACTREPCLAARAALADSGEEGQ